MKAIHTILTAAVLAATQPAAAQDLKKLAIGYPPSVEILPTIVAKESGCLERAGFDAELTVIPIATNIPPALLSGSLQIGMITATILLPAAENGLDLVAVAGASRMQKGNEGISIVTRPDLKVETAAQLEGKKIGVPGIMSVGDLIFRKWLKDSGVDVNKVTYVEVPFPRMADMMKSGTIDGVLAADPIRSGLVAGGLGQRAGVEYYSAVADGAILTFWASTGAWAKENPEAIAAYKTCINESIAWLKANPEESAKVQQTHLKFTTSFVPAWTADIAAADLDFYAAISKEFGLVRTDLDTGALVAGAN